MNGRGVTRDPNKALKWFRKSADQGYGYAQYNLGRAWQKGDGLPKNPEEAVFWFRKAASQGLPKAQYQLGVAYHMGLGVPKEPRTAHKWFSKSFPKFAEAAESGDLWAQDLTGFMLEHGLGIQKDIPKALAWYRRAAENNYALSQLKLGRLYGIGEVVEWRPIEALIMFRRAALNGNTEAAIYWRRQKWSIAIGLVLLAILWSVVPAVMTKRIAEKKGLGCVTACTLTALVFGWLQVIWVAMLPSRKLRTS